MKQLRIALPPLAHLSAQSPVPFAWLDKAGRVIERGQGTLARWANTPAVCFLHPRDSQLTSLELPKLPPAKIDAAVACAAQALILGPVEQMHVAHGPRDSNGQVQIGWLPTRELEHLTQVLAPLNIRVRGLYPAPYALAVSTSIGAVFIDGHLLLRHSEQQGAVHPLGERALDDLHSAGANVQMLDDDARWSGALPGWGLQGRLKATRPAGWGRALAFTALAVLVWTLGLNLYAARQVDEGQRLKAHMSAQVRRAFPELPVILNPLQQARQQLAARANGTGSGPGFSRLLTQAASHLPFMVASVERLTYEQGRLHLALLADTRPPASSDWQTALAQAGFSATVDAQGWTFSPQGKPDETGAEDE